MSVLGVGLDLCPVDRMRSAIERHGDRFLARILTADELQWVRRLPVPYETIAGRFAAKEATSKALGAPRGIGWHDVQVLPAEPGARGPGVVLRGRALEVAQAGGITTVLLSITHSGGMAAAVAVAIG